MTSTEGPTGGVRMRLSHAGQRFATALRSPIGSSTEGPTAPVGVFACVPPTQDSVSWLHREPHRRPQWG
eukprot:8232285-Pyramimonas_sp.AAC.1